MKTLLVMKKLIAFFAALILALNLAASCAGKDPSPTPSTVPETTAQTPSEPAQTQEDTMTMQLTVNGRTFRVTLAGTDAARALTELLPLTLEMRELNGNEKYAYLDETLPADSRAVVRIEAGDVMLYGDSCLVVFYESFDTGYSYTPVGHIDDPSALAETLGAGDVTAAWGS